VIDATAREFARGGIRRVPGDGVLRLGDLRIQEPDGRVLLDGANATVHAGERVAITGPSGTGKTLLLRAIAGIWSFGAGRVEIPDGARMLFVGQWPYIPIGTLRAAASYPAPEGTFSDDSIGGAMRVLGLDRFVVRLGDAGQWDQLLSPHEQQQLALVRVLLHEPEWIFLDKCTSALDEATEKRAYEILAERLPGATVMSIAHRPTVAPYHVRHWTLVSEPERVSLQVA
jgi:putative ATP-binding cassette transporter